MIQLFKQYIRITKFPLKILILKSDSLLSLRQRSVAMVRRLPWSKRS